MGMSNAPIVDTVMYDPIVVLQSGVGGGANVYEFGRFQNAATKGVGHVTSNIPARASEPIPNAALDWVGDVGGVKKTKPYE